MEFKRSLAKKIPQFKGKLIFISGPRQSGKTFLIKHVLKPDLELNLDIASDRARFKKMPEEIIAWYEREIGTFPKIKSPKKKPLVFIDEIQKVRGWRNLIKGTFDKTQHAIAYVASGSSAFEIRKQDAGDSLAGRAVWLTLFPLSFREYIHSLAPTLKLPEPWKGRGKLLKDLIRKVLPHQKTLRKLWNDYAKYGSYPENLLRKNERFLRQWLSDYQSAMLDRDLKDLNLGKDVERIYQVYELLLEGLGSTYSLRSLGETLSASANTIKGDIRALRQVLWGYELEVSQTSRARQIRKEKKFFPVDFCFARHGAEQNQGGVFESTVAALLYRGLHSETSGFSPPLHLGFYRDYAKHEVDLIVRDKKGVLLALECKCRQKDDLLSLRFFQKNSPLESFCIVEEENIFDVRNEICTASVELFAACLE